MKLALNNRIIGILLSFTLGAGTSLASDSSSEGVQKRGKIAKAPTKTIEAITGTDRGGVIELWLESNGSVTRLRMSVGVSNADNITDVRFYDESSGIIRRWREQLRSRSEKGVSERLDETICRFNGWRPLEKEISAGKVDDKEQRMPCDCTAQVDLVRRLLERCRNVGIGSSARIDIESDLK